MKKASYWKTQPSLQRTVSCVCSPLLMQWMKVNTLYVHIFKYLMKWRNHSLFTIYMLITLFSKLHLLIMTALAPDSEQPNFIPGWDTKGEFLPQNFHEEQPTYEQGAEHTFLSVNLQGQRHETHVCTHINAHTLILSRHHLLLLYLTLVVLWSFNVDDPEYSLHILS